MTNQRLLLTDTFETWAKKFNGALDDIDTVIENIPSLDKLAPKNHASEENTYGVGNARLFGHVKLSDDIDSESNVENGVGATPAAVKKAYDKASTAQNTANSAQKTANSAMEKASTVFTGSTPGLVPEATPEDAKKVLFGNGMWGNNNTDTVSFITLSEDLHLTNASSSSIVVSATQPNLSIYLPDSTSLQNGDGFKIWIISNDETIKHSIFLKGFKGEIVANKPILDCETAIVIKLIDNIKGIWALADYNAGYDLGIRNSLTIKINNLKIFADSSESAANVTLNKLTDNTALICYEDWADDLSACVVTISDNDIIVSDVTNLYSLDDIYSFTTLTLSQNKVFICFSNNRSETYVKAAILNINGTKVTHSTPVQLKSSTGGYINAINLSSNKILVCYRYNNYLSGCIIDIINNTTIKKIYEFSGLTEFTSIYNLSLVSLSSSKALLFCSGNIDKMYYNNLYILTINNNNVTLGNPVSLIEPIEDSSGIISNKYISFSKISENKVIVAFYNNIIKVLQCCILTINNDNIILGSRKYISTEFYSSTVYVHAISETQAIIFYGNLLTNSDNHYGISCVISINDTDIAIGSKTIFNLYQLAPSNISMYSLNDTNDKKFLIIYSSYPENENNNYYGNVGILTLV